MECVRSMKLYGLNMPKKLYLLLLLLPSVTVGVQCLRLTPYRATVAGWRRLFLTCRKRFINKKMNILNYYQ